MHPYIGHSQAQAHIDDLVRYAEARRSGTDEAPRRKGLFRRLRAAEADVLRLHGMGPNTMQQLRDALSARGLSFRG
jgi:hypothetical protein